VSQTESPVAPPASLASRIRAVRGASFGMVSMLLVEYGLGLWVNIYANLPSSDRGANVASGFGRAVADGPVGLALHALLGVALLVTGIMLVVRAAQLGRRSVIVWTSVGLLAVLSAALNGARFVGDRAHDASLVMGLGAGVAILAYTVILFTLTPAPE